MQPGDAAAVAAIYNEGIASRQATLDPDPVSAEQVASWVTDDSTLVAERDGAVVGFVRVGPYSSRRVYAGVGECTVYVAGHARRRGVGRELIEAACEEYERRDYWKLTGKLFTENEASAALLRACGFRDVGVHLRHGRLDGRWRDVLVVERLLGEAAGGA